MSATRSDAPYVAVIGRGEYEERTCVHAEEIGRALAERGAVVVCGGLGGVMEAVARGAKAADGATIGQPDWLADPPSTDSSPSFLIALPIGLLRYYRLASLHPRPLARTLRRPAWSFADRLALELL